jgi:hypothetical protein
MLQELSSDPISQSKILVTGELDLIVVEEVIKAIFQV